MSCLLSPVCCLGCLVLLCYLRFLKVGSLCVVVLEDKVRLGQVRLGLVFFLLVSCSGFIIFLALFVSVRVVVLLVLVLVPLASCLFLPFLCFSYLTLP